MELVLQLGAETEPVVADSPDDCSLVYAGFFSFITFFVFLSLPSRRLTLSRSL